MKSAFILLFQIVILHLPFVGNAQEYLGTIELNSNVQFNTNSKRIKSSESVVLKPGFTAKPNSGQSLTISIGLPSGVDDKYLNWTASKTFDQHGQVVSASKVFFDGNGTSIQNQSWDAETGHVFASQSIKDKYGNIALQTLSAPILLGGFSYQPFFIAFQKLSSGEVIPYSHRRFDKPTHNLQADPVVDTKPGTLGWYYSNNNTLEPLLDITTQPFSITKYKEASGEVVASFAPGEALGQGSGRQISSRTLSAFDELSGEYADFYSKVFTGSTNSFTKNVIKSISNDANGRVGINYSNSDGLSLASCMEDDDASAQMYTYKINQNIHTLFVSNILPSIQYYLHAEGYIKVFKNAVAIYEGDASHFFEGLVRGQNYKIQSDKEFFVSYVFMGPITIMKSTPSGVETGNEVYIPKNASLLNFSSNIPNLNLRVLNLTDGQVLLGTAASIKPNLQAGKIYRFEFIDFPNYNESSSSFVQLSFSAKLGNWNYNFYDNKGRLVSSISPNGVHQLRANPASYNQIDKVTYQYDTQDRLIASKEVDSGESQNIYRKDGSIRFSQNAKQRAESLGLSGALNSIFSYTNYDRIGRPIESGEYFIQKESFYPGEPIESYLVFNNAAMHAILENVSADGGLQHGHSRSWHKTSYDLPDPACPRNQDYTYGVVTATENEHSKTWYSYDELGRVTWVIRRIKFTHNSFKEFTIDYTYDYFGNVTEVAYQKEVVAEAFYHRYTYDKISRLKKVETKTASTPWQEEAEYYYYLHGPLKRVELANNLQGIDYVYTINGMLKSINHPETSRDPGKDGNNGFAKDVFGMTLEYYNGDYTRANTNIASINTQRNDYTGNIQGMTWRVDNTDGTLGSPRMYLYDYDQKHQLANSQRAIPSFANRNFTGANNAYTERGLSYDANGNIKTLQRFEANPNSVTDNFTYTYQGNTNKLTSVSNYAHFAYNTIGQMVKQDYTDAGQADQYVEYDVTGKAIAIYSHATYNASKDLWTYNPVDKKVSFAYDDHGQRIMKKDHTNNEETWYINDASGNLLAIYEKKNATPLTQLELPIYGSGRLGLYRKSSNLSNYELKDHLGTVRALINRTKRSNGQADITYIGDYYPFGGTTQVSAGIPSRFGYQGEYAEMDGETGWNAFELRMYDSKIGRWLSIDPYGQFWSPFNGMGNNPINGIDKDGGWLDDIYTNSQTNETHVVQTNLNYDRYYIDGSFSGYSFKGSWIGNYDNVKLFDSYNKEFYSSYYGKHLLNDSFFNRLINSSGSKQAIFDARVSVARSAAAPILYGTIAVPLVIIGGGELLAVAPQIASASSNGYFQLVSKGAYMYEHLGQGYLYVTGIANNYATHYLRVGASSLGTALAPVLRNSSIGRQVHNRIHEVAKNGKVDIVEILNSAYDLYDNIDNFIK